VTSAASYQKSRLIELVREHALRFGEFRLASGQLASFYLDCRKLTLHGEGANQVALGMLERLEQTGWPDAVGGMAIGADPITAAIITVGWQQGRALRGFMVRKEPKAHGTGQQVEGPVGPGDRAVIVEDVVTTGGSSLRAIELVRAAGLEVDRCIAIIDRQQGAAEKFAAIGVQLHSLLTRADLGLPSSSP
jgi:orotate phosphoribosyltransferase